MATRQERIKMTVQVEIMVDVTVSQYNATRETPAEYDVEIAFDEDELIRLAKEQLENDYNDNN